MYYGSSFMCRILFIVTYKSCVHILQNTIRRKINHSRCNGINILPFVSQSIILINSLFLISVFIKISSIQDFGILGLIGLVLLVKVNILYQFRKTRVKNRFFIVNIIIHLIICISAIFLNIYK